MHLRGCFERELMMKKYDWRDGIPIVNWFSDRTVNKWEFEELCSIAEISTHMGRMGILCTPWKGHQVDDIVVANLREFAIFGRFENKQRL